MQIADKTPSDKTTRELRRIAVEIRREKHTAKVDYSQINKKLNIFQQFYRALGAEIEDELQLRTNYNQIMSDLESLEKQARQQPTPNIIEQIHNVELEIDLLRKQCTKPRHYVASSIEGTAPDQSSPTRRRKILLKVTNSVTTIIKGSREIYLKIYSIFSLVVEDALKRQAKKSKKPETESTDLQQIHRRLSELQSATEEDTQRIEKAEVVFKQNPEIESLIESAIQVRQSIDAIIQNKEVPSDEYGQLLQSSMVSYFFGVENILDISLFFIK